MSNRTPQFSRPAPAISWFVALTLGLTLTTGCNLARAQRPIDRATPRPTTRQGRTATPNQQPTLVVPPTATILPIPTRNPNVRSLMRERQTDLFNNIWEVVRDNYLQPDLNGLDWNAERANMLERIKGGISDDAFYDAVVNLIERLGDEHSYFLSPSEVQKQNQQAAGRFNYAGIGIIVSANIERGYLYLEQVFPGSPAEKAGLKAHDHILEIEGQPAIVDGVRSDNHIVGEVGTRVRLKIQTPGQEPRNFEITRAVVNGKEAVQSHIITGTDKSRIGYILIPNLYEQDMRARVQKALSEMTSPTPLTGLIIDMRINGGGSYLIVRQILSLFTKGVVGGFADRSGIDEFDTFQVEAEKLSNLQDVPLAVLIGPQTESFGEVFAGILQDQNRAMLVGLPSAGNIELLYPHDFTGGSQLWLAEKRFVLPDGSSWERRGLAPDIRVNTQWDEHTAEDDPVVEAALKKINEIKN